MNKGQRVKTPLGYGTVCYVRMRPPEYREIEAVSVLLEARRNMIGYSGTIIKAELVEEVR